jgi:hypothetical protein
MVLAPYLPRNHQLHQPVLGSTGNAFNPLKCTGSRAGLTSGPRPLCWSRQAEAVTRRGGQALALPGGPLQPVTAHKLQGGGWWPAGFKAGPASLCTRKRFVQPNTLLSGISVTPERANNGVSLTHVEQTSLPAQTCP